MLKNAIDFLQMYNLQMPLLLFFGIILFIRINQTGKVKNVHPASGNWKDVFPRSRFRTNRFKDA